MIINMVSAVRDRILIIESDPLIADILGRQTLQAAGFQGELTNLTGGITAWSNDVDPSVPKY